MKNKKTTGHKSVFFSNILLIITASFLFIFANPNFVSNRQFGFLGFFLFIPVLLCIKRTSPKILWLFGMLYGVLTYSLYVLWLKSYELSFYIALLVFYALVMALLFEFLKLIDFLFEEKAWLVQWLALCSFDYLRTLGFLGFHFGVTGYTQWQFTSFIQCADTIGFFGMNLLVLFPSVLIYSFIAKLSDRKKLQYQFITDNQLYECDTHLNYVEKQTKEQNKTSLKLNFLLLAAWILVFCGAIFYGKLKIKENSSQNTVKIASIQNNSNSNNSGISVYTEDVRNLMQITNEAIEMEPDIDFILWPETAVVPSVVYQYNEGKDEGRKKLVTSLLNFINDKQQVFVIGNAHINVKDGKKISYNSALVFEPGKNVLPPTPGIYSKNHLVPVNEYFPFDKHFPKLKKYLLSIDSANWEPGTELKVFDYNGLKFGVPICFEDNFTDIARKMKNDGAQCLFNLSNDSWSQKEYCQKQHLAISVFRAVENRIPIVRSTASGVTCYIDSNGTVAKEIEQFTKGYLVCEVPVVNCQKKNLYSITGDVFGIVPCILLAGLLIMEIFIVIIKKHK